MSDYPANHDDSLPIPHGWHVCPVCGVLRKDGDEELFGPCTYLSV